MEGPLKERLTGALIVVAVLVVVVPEMLSGPGKSSAASKSAGDAGPPVRTYSLELGTPTATRTQDQSTLTPQSSEPATVPAAQPQSEPPPASAATQPVSSEVAAAREQRPVPADVKRVAPAPEMPAVAAPAASAKGQWWTQLGSFSARENAERLARDLRGRGYTITVARIKVGNRDLYRVRAGPAGNREAALALQSRLAAAGHKSSLVPP